MPRRRTGIQTVSGTSASRLGLAAHPEQSARCVAAALEAGVNYFFFYGPGHGQFIQALNGLLPRTRETLIVATGSGSRSRSGLMAARRKILKALPIDLIDVFFAEYVHPAEDANRIFGDGGVLDQLQQWKADGWIRYVGATAHDRSLARRLALDQRVDVLMHRFNMAHRKAVTEVFPAAQERNVPVIAFTATRWATLLEANPKWTAAPPTAADCYRYCLAHKAISTVLSAPKTLAELQANLIVLDAPAMRRNELRKWEEFGDVVYGTSGRAFESRWP